MTPREHLAGEYALGLLEGEALLEARGLATNDPAFAAQVEWWQAQLAPLLDGLAPVAPPEELWPRIAARLEAQPAGEIVALRRRVRRWQVSTGLAAAAALVVAVLAGPTLFGPGPAPSAPPAPLVAAFELPATPVRLGLTYLPERGDLLVAAGGLSADGVHDHELWVVPPGGAPVSLGVVAPGQARRVHLAPAVAARLAAGATVALSREPLGGSATGTPGPVVATAKFTAT